MSWTWRDALLGLVVANVVGLVGGVVVLSVAVAVDPDLTTAEVAGVADLPLSLVALAQVPLTLGYLSWPWLHGVRRGPGLVDAFGLRMRWTDVPVGLGAGLGTQLVLIPLLYLPLLSLTDIDTDDLSERARSLTDKATTVSGVVLLVVVVAVAAPIVEELFFRGFLQPAFGVRFGRRWGVAASSLLFAAVHLQALQFAALAVFGLVAALLTERFGRLGPAIWAHVGFNATAVVSLLAA